VSCQYQILGPTWWFFLCLSLRLYVLIEFIFYPPPPSLSLFLSRNNRPEASNRIGVKVNASSVRFSKDWNSVRFSYTRKKERSERKRGKEKGKEEGGELCFAGYTHMRKVYENMSWNRRFVYHLIYNDNDAMIAVIEVAFLCYLPNVTHFILVSD